MGCRAPGRRRETATRGRCDLRLTVTSTSSPLAGSRCRPGIRDASRRPDGPSARADVRLPSEAGRTRTTVTSPRATSRRRGNPACHLPLRHAVWACLAGVHGTLWKPCGSGRRNPVTAVTRVPLPLGGASRLPVAAPWHRRLRDPSPTRGRHPPARIDRRAREAVAVVEPTVVRCGGGGPPCDDGDGNAIRLRQAIPSRRPGTCALGRATAGGRAGRESLDAT
jgi:hypothetical protein